jgi:hypothetical protein
MVPFIPEPPQQHAIHHTAPPISVADDATFERWMALPASDTRTLEEFAANPVDREVTWHFGPKPPPGASTASTDVERSLGLLSDSGSTFCEVHDRPDGPKNCSVRAGIQPDTPWPRK